MGHPPLAAPSHSDDTSALSRRQLVFMVAALVASVVSFSLNSTMVGPAYRDINTALGPDAFVTMSTYFYLAGALANVVLIRWSDYIGRKRVLLAILVVMCVGTVLCIVATSLPVFTVGRLLQGTSNITYGLAFLLLREYVKGPAFGVCCGVVSSINGGVAGGDALLSGIMVDRWGYRSIFVLILAVGIAGLLFAWKAIPADEPGKRASGRMDWIGAALIALTVGGINLFLSNGGHGGWLSPVALAWMAVAAAALIALVVVDSRIAHPLIAIQHMRSREAWPLIVVTILVMGSFIVVLGYIIPALAEDPDSGFGHNATMAALLFLTPAAVVQIIAAPFIGRLAVRIGFVTVLRAGIASTIVVTALLAFFAQQQTAVIVVMVLFGITCNATLLTAMGTLGVLQASDEEPGALPGLANASYGIGASLGFAWAGPVVGSGTDASFQHAFWACTAIGVAALVFSLILKPKQNAMAPAAVGPGH
ncbi:MAG: MFS transporter [Actinobacteria bacterium]|nr:MFS transporter [Actinomycetota bacterium]MBS1900330.1 MFS transporter [Actinomycetota bacterium]